ncbi:UNVERIFIED_CONTAM: F-actin-capping protein subunit alpha, partial [Siphonaria sp. JEL0065]
MSNGMADLTTVLKRLEAATERLEEIVAGKGGRVVPSGTPAVNGSPLVAAYDALIEGHVKPVVAKAAALGGLLAAQAEHVAAAFEAQRVFVGVAAKAAKPRAADLPSLLKNTQVALANVVEVRDAKNARADPLFNHLSLVAEGIPALGWVAVEPTPVPYIGDLKDAAQFYSNRVIKEYKDKDKAHVEFAQAFIALLSELQAYVKTYHTTGVAWNNAKG